MLGEVLHGIFWLDRAHTLFYPLAGDLTEGKRQ